MKVIMCAYYQNDNKMNFEITNEKKTIGRSNQADFVINDELISNVHCEVYLNNQNEIIINDLDSKNGTAINGIFKKNHRVFVNDTITIGNTKIVIDVDKSDLSAFNHLSFEGDEQSRKNGNVTIEIDKLEKLSPTQSLKINKKNPKNKKKYQSKLKKNLDHKYQLAFKFDLIIGATFIIFSILIIGHIEGIFTRKFDTIKMWTETNQSTLIIVKITISLLIGLVYIYKSKSPKFHSIGKKLIHLN